jgi:hypothetical protein
MKPNETFLAQASALFDEKYETPTKLPRGPHEEPLMYSKDSGQTSITMTENRNGTMSEGGIRYTDAANHEVFATNRETNGSSLFDMSFMPTRARVIIEQNTPDSPEDGINIRMNWADQKLDMSIQGYKHRMTFAGLASAAAGNIEFAIDAIKFGSLKWTMDPTTNADASTKQAMSISFDMTTKDFPPMVYDKGEDTTTTRVMPLTIRFSANTSLEYQTVESIDTPTQSTDIQDISAKLRTILAPLLPRSQKPESRTKPPARNRIKPETLK